jgi:hypothetical protein
MGIIDNIMNINTWTIKETADILHRLSCCSKCTLVLYIHIPMQKPHNHAERFHIILIYYTSVKNS